MQKSLLAPSTLLLALTFTACNRAPNQVAAASSNPEPTTPAAAQDSDAKAIQIRLSSTHRTYTCDNPGDAVQVTGSSDVLTIIGNCGSLQVTGSSNTITVDSVQSVQFTGDSNSVLYRSSHKPTVNDDGQSNSIAHTTGQVASSHSNIDSFDNGSTPSQTDSTSVNGTPVGAIVSSAMQRANAASQAAAATAGAVQSVQNTATTLNIILSRQQTTQDCGDGKTVNINGYQNDITLTGSCGKIILNGWGNTIHIEEVAAIEVMGHTNNITWERGRNARKPIVQIDGGMDNSVSHMTSAN